MDFIAPHSCFFGFKSRPIISFVVELISAEPACPPMASPRRVFRIYESLFAHAAEIRDFMQAKGEAVPGTVKLLLAGDRNKLLSRWGEEMEELCGVLDGSHLDSYLMESTQTFYWGSLFAVSGGANWDVIDFDNGRRQAGASSLDMVTEIRSATKRMVELGAEKVKPNKLFLLWHAADWIYRRQTLPENQWSIEQLMEADLQEMKKRPYLEPILKEITE